MDDDTPIEWSCHSSPYTEQRQNEPMSTIPPSAPPPSGVVVFGGSNPFQGMGEVDLDAMAASRGSKRARLAVAATTPACQPTIWWNDEKKKQKNSSENGPQNGLQFVTHGNGDVTGQSKWGQQQQQHVVHQQHVHQQHLHQHQRGEQNGAVRGMFKGGGSGGDGGGGGGSAYCDFTWSGDKAASSDMAVGAHEKEAGGANCSAGFGGGGSAVHPNAMMVVGGGEQQSGAALNGGDRGRSAVRTNGVERYGGGGGGGGIASGGGTVISSGFGTGGFPQHQWHQDQGGSSDDMLILYGSPS